MSTITSKKKDKKIGKLEQLMADVRAENARYRKEAKKAARQTRSMMDLMREDLDEIKDDLQHVRGDLQQVSRKLGVALSRQVARVR